MDTHGHSAANASTSVAGTPADVGEQDAYACPLCGGHALVRIHRRPIDRILGLIVRLRRFRCTEVGCQWEGNLRASAGARGRYGSKA